MIGPQAARAPIGWIGTPEGSPELTWTRYRYGRFLIDAGERRAAIEPLRGAVRGVDAIPLSDDRRGLAHYALARALWAEPSQRAQALWEAEVASELLATDEPELADEARRWRRARARRGRG